MSPDAPRFGRFRPLPERWSDSAVVDAEIVEDEQPTEEAEALVISTFTEPQITATSNAIAITTVAIEIGLVLAAPFVVYLMLAQGASEIPKWAAFLAGAFLAGAAARTLLEAGHGFRTLYRRWVSQWPDRQEWAARMIATAPRRKALTAGHTPPPVSSEWVDMASKIEDEHGPLHVDLDFPDKQS